jgi:hypothetical protein
MSGFEELERLKLAQSESIKNACCGLFLVDLVQHYLAGHKLLVD